MLCLLSRQVMEQQQHRQESLERRTSATGEHPPWAPSPIPTRALQSTRCLPGTKLRAGDTADTAGMVHIQPGSQISDEPMS